MQSQSQNQDQSQAQKPKALSIDIPQERYVLPSNGLEVILAVNHRLPIVAVNIWYHAGPANEAEGRTGFAHLFEHLMFQGSKHVGDDRHFKLLEAAGASLINGTTSFDRTNYFETVPANQLALALWLESDRMGFLHPSLSEEKLQNQRDVVMNERRQSVDNAPYGKSREALIQTLFQKGHPYHGNVIGSMDDLQAASLKDVRDFYDAYYAPANATLVVAGDFDPQEAKALIQAYFGDLPRRKAPSKPTIKTPPITVERRVEIREDIALPRVSAAWHAPTAYAPGDATADVLATVLGQGRSSRLYRALVFEQQIAQDVQAWQYSLGLASIFGVQATAKPGVSLDKLEMALWREIEKIRTTPPSAAEVAKAQNLLATSLVAGLQSIGGFGGVADMLNRYNHYLGDPDYFSQDLARYSKVDPKAVQTLAYSLLDPNKRAVVLTLPEKK